MKIVETTFERLPRERLEIGFEGENLRATVRIDCASVFAEYPNATPALIVKPLFADAYPVVVDRNGTDVDWLITSEILSFNGDGEIQLVFYKDEVICKSAVSKIRVSRSLQATGDRPDPIARWEDAANQKLHEVDAVIVSIDEMDATAHGLPEGSAPTAEVQTVDDHKRIVLGIPVGATGATGAKGDKGDRGEVGATPQMGIGTVQTLPAGSSATASMSGTTENPLLNLGIPQGIQGVKGDRGEKGDTGAAGATGATPDFSIGTVSTLPAGSSATAEITGTPENPALSFGIPQGVQGIQGEKGDKGDPGDGTPTGGLTDQVLAKASDTDRDTKWMYVAPVVKNEASGAIASFSDGADWYLVDELKVKIEPVQDLHGYDHPWPAGGGKNLFDGILERGNLRPDNTNVLYSRCANFIPVNGNTTYTMLFADIPTMEASTGQVYTLEYDSNKQYIDNTRGARKYGLTSGSSITFTTVETAKYVRFFIYDTVEHPLTDFKKIQFEEGSTATSYEPYSNICPITGWDGVQVTRTGKNLCDESNLLLAEGWTVTDGVYSGTNTALHIAFSNGFPGMAFKPDTTYTVSLVFRSTTASKITVIGFNYTDGTHSTMYMQDTVEHTVSFTSTSGKSVSNLLLSYGAGDKVYISQMQVEEGSTATDYEPYAGNTYSIAIPTEAGTVYGGTLDVSTGELVVDTISAELTGTVICSNWDDADRDSMGFYLNADSWTYNTGLPNPVEGNGIFSYCYNDSVYLTNNWWAARLLFTSGSFNRFEMRIPKNVLTTVNVAGAKAYLDEHPLQVVYKIAPQTYTLTPTQIRTLLGTNNIWADTGNVSVKYNADTKLYIDGKIAELVAQIVNS